MKSRLTIFFILIWPIFLYAATRNATSDGNWTDETGTSPWFADTAPTGTDEATSDANVDLTVESSDNVSAISFTPSANGSLTIDAGGTLTLNNTGLDAMIIASNYALTVDGTLVINGNLNVSNVLTLVVTGDIIVNGDVILGNGASLDVTGSGTITIDGDFTAGNSTDVDVDLNGSIDVTGSVDVGNGSTLTGDGTFTAGEGCTGDTDFCDSSTLPVSLLFFKANDLGTFVRVEWATYKQLGFDYFCLERSLNGLDYTCLTTISGEGDNETIINYSFDDLSPIPGKSYYRLKAVDLDKTFEYFNIIKMERNQESSFSVYPNPTNGDFKLQLGFIPNDQLHFTIYDLRGRVYSTGPVTSHNVEFSKLKLLPGVYLFQLEDSNGYSESKRLLVN